MAARVCLVKALKVVARFSGASAIAITMPARVCSPRSREVLTIEMNDKLEVFSAVIYEDLGRSCQVGGLKITSWSTVYCRSRASARDPPRDSWQSSRTSIHQPGQICSPVEAGGSEPESPVACVSQFFLTEGGSQSRRLTFDLSDPLRVSETQGQACDCSSCVALIASPARVHVQDPVAQVCDIRADERSECAHCPADAFCAHCAADFLLLFAKTLCSSIPVLYDTSAKLHL